MTTTTPLDDRSAHRRANTVALGRRAAESRRLPRLQRCLIVGAMASDTIDIQFVCAAAHTAQANDIELEMVLEDVIYTELLGHDLGRVTSVHLVRIVMDLWHRTDEELFSHA